MKKGLEGGAVGKQMLSSGRAVDLVGAERTGTEGPMPGIWVVRWGRNTAKHEFPMAKAPAKLPVHGWEGRTV